MGCENTWTDDNKGLYKKMTGEVSVVEILNENNAMFWDKKFENLNYVIYDFRNITKQGSFKPEEIHSVAKVTRIRANSRVPAKLALISRNNPDSVKAAEFFCHIMSSSNVLCKTFICPNEANSWATQ